MAPNRCREAHLDPGAQSKELSVVGKALLAATVMPWRHAVVWVIRKLADPVVGEFHMIDPDRRACRQLPIMTDNRRDFKAPSALVPGVGCADEKVHCATRYEKLHFTPARTGPGAKTALSRACCSAALKPSQRWAMSRYSVCPHTARMIPDGEWLGPSIRCPISCATA
jgi:hypothetical protein